MNNDGNFRALLRYRAKGGDQSLTDHLLSSAHNATYLSPTIQNEIIDACNDLISGELVRKVNAARCFSVLADKTAKNLLPCTYLSDHVFKHLVLY